MYYVPGKPREKMSTIEKIDDALLELQEARGTVPGRWPGIKKSIDRLGLVLEKIVKFDYKDKGKKEKELADAFMLATYEIYEGIKNVPTSWGLTYGFNNIYYALDHLSEALEDGPIKTSIGFGSKAFRTIGVALVMRSEARRLTNNYETDSVLNARGEHENYAKTGDITHKRAAWFLEMSETYYNDSVDLFSKSVKVLADVWQKEQNNTSNNSSRMRK